MKKEGSIYDDRDHLWIDDALSEDKDLSATNTPLD